jgi:lipoprotein-releasing system permease protein
VIADVDDRARDNAPLQAGLMTAIPTSTMKNGDEVVLWLIPALFAVVVLVVGTILTTRGLAGVVARRYLTHVKLTIVSTITLFAVLGTTLAVAALTTVTGISTGFQAEFQRKVLGVNAHVLILKYLDFTEYRDVMTMVTALPGVVGANPFVINEMMVVHGPRLAGVLLKGIDPELMPTVLDLPQHMVAGTLDGLRLPGRQPPDARAPRWSQPWTDDGPDGILDPPFVDGDDPGAPPPLPDKVPPQKNEAPPAPPAPVADGQVESALEGVVSAPASGDALSVQILDEAVADALGVDYDAEPTATANEDVPGIVLGRTLAQELDARVGDRVRIVTPLSGLDVSLWAPEAQVPRSREFRVTGIFYSGFDEYDTRLVYVDLYEAQSFYDHGDVVTGVELRLEDPSLAPLVAEQVDENLGGTPYRILDWEQLNHNLFTALRIQKVALTIVVLALVLVSGLLIIATLVLLIFEKRKEIAVLKAMGATNGAVMRIFLFIGAAIGAVGTFLGVGLGYGVCRILIAYGWSLDPGVYLIDHLPVEIDPLDYFFVSAVALAVSVISTVIPSWITAATMKPVDGLRYE